MPSEYAPDMHQNKTDQTNIDSISEESLFKCQDDDLSTVSRGAGWRCCEPDECAAAECCSAVPVGGRRLRAVLRWSIYVSWATPVGHVSVNSSSRGLLRRPSCEAAIALCPQKYSAYRVEDLWGVVALEDVGDWSWMVGSSLPVFCRQPRPTYKTGSEAAVQWDKYKSSSFEAEMGAVMDTLHWE